MVDYNFHVQLVAKKTGYENFPKFGFVHLSINCLLDNTYQIFFLRRFHTMEKL
jgi:hypothetical protein